MRRDDERREMTTDAEVLTNHRREMVGRGHPIYEVFDAIESADLEPDACVQRFNWKGLNSPSSWCRRA